MSNDELRRALNIHRDKLPIWIYRMRVLGYPPGWLQHATVNTLAIFDGSNEDGELDDKSEASVQQYNKEALIEYPGFNTPVPEGVRDDWYMLGMPPMLPTQQLNEALKTMKVSEPVPYKRTKFDTSSTSGSPSTSFASTSTPKSPEVSSNHNSNKTSLNESFNTPNKVQTISTICDSDNKVNDSIEEESNNTEPKNPSDTPNKSLNESLDGERKLKLISMGSPMPVSENTKRPSLDKWAVGMGELLYFENPSEEYTGVYKTKMKGLIEKIRQKHSQT